MRAFRETATNWHTLEEAASALRVSIRTLVALIRANRITAVVAFGAMWIRDREVRRFREGRERRAWLGYRPSAWMTPRRRWAA